MQHQESNNGQVHGFLNSVGAIVNAHRDARKLYGERLAPDYNVFDVIKPNETNLSRVLAWLLDPNATHGQRGRFLRLFFDALRTKMTEEECDNAVVRTEFPITEGRLDIYVKLRKFHLVIENKPWAGDQDEQLARYFKHFDVEKLNTGTIKEAGYKIIYLTPKGEGPSEKSLSVSKQEERSKSGTFCVWGYENHILNWLDGCRAQCRADRVSILIDEFARYIRATFKEERDPTMSDHLVGEIVKDPGKTSSAMQVILLGDNIRERLFLRLYDQLLDKLKDRQPQKKWAEGRLGKESDQGFTLEYSAHSLYQCWVCFQNKGFTKLYIGIRPKSGEGAAEVGERETDRKCREALDNKVKKGEAEDDYPWVWWVWAGEQESFFRVARDWNNTPEPWGEIVSGKLADEIVEAFNRTREVLKDAGVLDSA